VVQRTAITFAKAIKFLCVYIVRKLILASKVVKIGEKC